MRVASQLLVSVALFLLLQFFLVFRASTSIRGLSSDGPVCFVTGDVLLVSKSRGTADGFSQLIASLSSRGVAVHVVLLAEDAVDCVNSGNAIQDSLKGVTSSCAQLDATAPLSAATTTLRHWATRSLPRTCRTVVTHDFWAPATLLFTERLLWPQRRHPSLVTNFMGGALWSSSWDVNRTTTYSDWMMDYDERMGGWAAGASTLWAPSCLLTLLPCSYQIFWCFRTSTTKLSTPRGGRCVAASSSDTTSTASIWCGAPPPAARRRRTR